VRLPQRLAEEALRGRRVPPGREQEVDRLTAAVDRPIEVGPAALHLHIGLVDPPRAIARTQVWTDPLLQFRRISLDPAEDRGVIHVYAPVSQHQLEVAVADREHEVPADCPEDHLGGELPSLERPALLHRARLMPSCHARLLPCRDRSEKLQQNRHTHIR
jgi:hypothetical protein